MAVCVLYVTSISDSLLYVLSLTVYTTLIATLCGIYVCVYAFHLILTYFFDICIFPHTFYIPRIWVIYYIIIIVILFFNSFHSSKDLFPLEGQVCLLFFSLIIFIRKLLAFPVLPNKYDDFKCKAKNLYIYILV